uniref:Calcineurin-like phosphoesterase domain-containing protein n=1 Tax=Plectus sambesii TaxID=2011161 RepID=A0A914W2T7_9BILA
MWRGWWLAIAALLAPIAKVDGGFALHISDFHLDNDYSPMNGDISFYCHSSTNGTRLGDYGDYMCDAPKSLVKNALNAASGINPTPQYIFWTGDNVPHIDNKLYNSSDVVRNIQQTTAQLIAAFPNVSKIFPVLGNHDYWPSNGFPDQQNPVYKGAFDQWKQWIGDQAASTFLKGGYYKYSLDSKTTLLALNTNLYYNEDGYFPNFTNPADPADQFDFMEQELSNATKNGQFVHIVAHIAPGGNSAHTLASFIPYV